LRIAWVIPVLVSAGAGAIAGPLWALAAGAAVAVALCVWIWVQGSLVLHSLHAVKLRPEQAPRLHNIATGLAARTHSAVPALWLIPDGGPNALVCRTGGLALAVTSSLLDRYTRVELEAVVAHCLIRLRKSAALSEALALRRLGITVSPCDVLWADAATAALTRYPPGLATAITKAQPRSDRFAPLWFVSSTPGQPAPSARAEMLQDL
jgi:hypothetical protein